MSCREVSDETEAETEPLVLDDVGFYVCRFSPVKGATVVLVLAFVFFDKTPRSTSTSCGHGAPAIEWGHNRVFSANAKIACANG